jgi:hypothetical protein
MPLQPFLGPWPLFQLLDPIHSRYDSSDGRSARRQGLYLHTEEHKHRINAHNTDIHALSGIGTHDAGVQASEGSSCLRPRGLCDRQQTHVTTDYQQLKFSAFYGTKKFIPVLTTAHN